MSGNAGLVLIVDDNLDTLAALGEALGALGYDVREAADGATALELARTEEPNVVLLDVIMPHMDGLETCRRLKSDPATRLIPVVMLTGQSGRRSRIDGLEAGATDFLSKPVDLGELDVRVRNLVQFHHLTQELDHAEQMVFSIAAVVEARDEITGDHCQRLSQRAVELGRRLHLGVADLTALRRAGYLHDIGKIAIPDAVLLKPGALTEDEWVIMRHHVDVGVQICAPLRSLRPVLPIIRHHHERRDGSGYPDGLAGDDIPLLARVFQIVDVFDALTNDRPYRKQMSPEDAIALMQKEAARGWWDPHLVEVFATMIRESGLAVPLESGAPKGLTSRSSSRDTVGAN